MNIPDKITLIRIFIVFPVIFLAYSRSIYLIISCILLIISSTFLDYLDGYFARKLNQSTKFGSIFDIMGDRIVEVTLYFIFAYLRMIPIWIPIIIFTRGAITDSLRGFALTKNKTPFGKNSMMNSKLSRFLTASRVMRVSANVKFLAFIALILSLIEPRLYFYALILTYISVAVNLLRGIPVIIDAKNLFNTT